jgi:hypothetical protein
MKVLIVLSCLIWQSIYLFNATQAFLQKRIKRELEVKYPTVYFRQQLLIIGIMAELLQAGIDPLNTIKSGLQMLEQNKRLKYQDLIGGKTIIEKDFLSNSISLILNSSISGSRISESLRLNLETFQRSHRNDILMAIKKSEVLLLGPLGLCFLPNFMLIAVVPLIGSLIMGYIS